MNDSIRVAVCDGNIGHVSGEKDDVRIIITARAKRTKGRSAIVRAGRQRGGSAKRGLGITGARFRVGPLGHQRLEGQRARGETGE